MSEGNKIPRKYKVGLLQMRLSKKGEENLNKAVSWVKDASLRGANIICLPELFKTEYFCQIEDTDLFDLAEPVDGKTVKILSNAAKENNVVVIVPIFEKRSEGVYHNTTVVIDENGNTIGTYRKMHIPDDPAFYEKFYFTPGDLGFKSFDTGYGKVGTLICWDQWFPEGARLTALQGANILFYPAAIGWHPKEKEKYGAVQLDAWKTVQRGHAIANGVYVAAVNRVGFEKRVEDSDGLKFWGSSFLADPQGVIIAQASEEKEEILIGEIDIDHLENIRRNWPFLRDRRIDAYSDITKRLID
ncbi:MAG: carbon-nitrogen hydrolase [Bacteroidetes bacterium]|nr:carbon-nitrogen hydrolase [Bacteroidota bacterium]MCH8171250.1 carbon-nitrogen hydrolase [Bacteroidota bacterium]MCH8942447.1 carbon-nitrogen hydrolase [Bacteroidota bacterium]